MRKLLIIALLFAISLSVYALVENEKPQVWRESCVGCGDCAIQCPMKAITVEDGKATIDQDKCINCKICLTACQYRAIK